MLSVLGPMMPRCTRTLCSVYCYVIIVLVLDNLVPVLMFSHTWIAKDILSAEECNAEVFHGERDVVDYFKLLLMEDEHMMIGARNIVYNISLNTLKEEEDRRLNWNTSTKDTTTCETKLDASLHNKCQNFIQVLGKTNGTLYVCGTNAFMPTCRNYEYKEANYPAQIPEYAVVGKEEKGIGKCPYDPDHNSTSIYLDGKLYSATVADLNGRDPLILKSDNTEYRIRTKQHFSNMLSDPQFVSAFDIDDKIYFFFRENAVENIHCGKTMFSRVARVCKTDQGGRFEAGVWTSFFKARLNCPFPGDIPFQFDELYSTSDFSFGNHMPTRDSSMQKPMIYGVFNTPDNSIQGSAVCAFAKDDIEAAFQGRFKGQESAAHNWLPIPHEETPQPHPATDCVNNSRNLPEETPPLMDMSVMALSGGPILFQTLDKGRFTAIAIDWQITVSDGTYYDIIFIGTTDGRVLKAINTGKDGQVQSIVIEDIQVLAVNETVKELKVFRSTNRQHEKLIVISKENIKSIPLSRCRSHTTCGDCVALQDPYCTWADNMCLSSASKRGLQDVSKGDASKCPDGGRRVDQIQIVVATTTTQKPELQTSCPECTCICNQSEQTVSIEAELKPKDGNWLDKPSLEDFNGGVLSSSKLEPCDTKTSTVWADGQIYTASTVAVAIVISIVVAALTGFIVGYRISLCRNHTRNTEEMISNEQQFGSLRKNHNRRSMDPTQNINFYSEANFQKQDLTIQKNVLVSNNILNKSPHLPNGSIENKTMSPTHMAKTYL